MRNKYDQENQDKKYEDMFSGNIGFRKNAGQGKETDVIRERGTDSIQGGEQESQKRRLQSSYYNRNIQSMQGESLREQKIMEAEYRQRQSREQLARQKREIQAQRFQAERYKDEGNFGIEEPHEADIEVRTEDTSNIQDEKQKQGHDVRQSSLTRKQKKQTEEGTSVLPSKKEKADYSESSVKQISARTTVSPDGSNFNAFNATVGDFSGTSGKVNVTEDGGVSESVNVEECRTIQGRTKIMEEGQGGHFGERARISDSNSSLHDINLDANDIPSGRKSLKKRKYFPRSGSLSSVHAGSGGLDGNKQAVDGDRLVSLSDSELVRRHAHFGEEMLASVRKGDAITASDTANNMMKIEEEMASRRKTGMLSFQKNHFNTEKAKLLAQKAVKKEKAFRKDEKIQGKSSGNVVGVRQNVMMSATGFVSSMRTDNSSGAGGTGKTSGQSKAWQRLKNSLLLGAKTPFDIISRGAGLETPEELQAVKKGTRISIEAARFGAGSIRSGYNGVRSAVVSASHRGTRRSARFEYGRVKKELKKKQIKKMKKRLFKRKIRKAEKKTVKAVVKGAARILKLSVKAIMTFLAPYAPYILCIICAAVSIGLIIHNATPQSIARIAVPSGMINDSDETDDKGEYIKIIQAALNDLWKTQVAYETNISDCKLDSPYIDKGLPQHWIAVADNKPEMKDKSPALVKKGGMVKGFDISSYWGERAGYYQDTVTVYDKKGNVKESFDVTINGPPGLKGDIGTYSVSDSGDTCFEVKENSDGYKKLYNKLDENGEETNINADTKVEFIYKGSSFTGTYTDVKTTDYYIGKGTAEILDYLASCGKGLDVSGYSDNAAAVWDYLISMGMSEAGAAGVMGNALIESSFNPEAYNPAGYYGLFQWGGGRLSFLQSRPNYNTVQVQLDYFKYEMEGQFPQLMSFLKTTDNPALAAEAFLVVHERAVGSDPSYCSPLQYSIPNYDGYGAMAGTMYQAAKERREGASNLFSSFSGHIPSPSDSDSNSDESSESEKTAEERLKGMKKHTYSIKDFYHAVVSMGIAYSWNSSYEKEDFIRNYYKEMFDYLMNTSDIEILEGAQIMYADQVTWKVKYKGKTYQCSDQRITKKIKIKITFNNLGVQDLMKGDNCNVQWAKNNGSIAYGTDREKQWEGWEDEKGMTFSQDWVLKYVEMPDKDWEFFFEDLHFPGNTVGTLSASDINRIVSEIRDNNGGDLTDKQEEMLRFTLGCVGRCTYDYGSRFGGSSSRPTPADCPAQLDCSGFMSFALYGGGADNSFNDRTAAALTSCYNHFMFSDVNKDLTRLKPCTMLMPNQDNGPNSGAHVVMYLGIFKKSAAEEAKPWCIECTTSMDENGNELSGVMISTPRNMQIIKNYNYASYPFSD